MTLRSKISRRRPTHLFLSILLLHLDSLFSIICPISSIEFFSASFSIHKEFKVALFFIFSILAQFNRAFKISRRILFSFFNFFISLFFLSFSILFSESKYYTKNTKKINTLIFYILSIIELLKFQFFHLINKQKRTWHLTKNIYIRNMRIDKQKIKHKKK